MPVTDSTTDSLVRLRNAMMILGITGDSLFARIRDDLERGLVDEARMQLNCIDVMVRPNANLHRTKMAGDNAGDS